MTEEESERDFIQNPPENFNHLRTIIANINQIIVSLSTLSSCMGNNHRSGESEFS